MIAIVAGVIVGWVIVAVAILCVNAAAARADRRMLDDTPVRDRERL